MSFAPPRALVGLTVLWCLGAVTARGAVFQYSVPVATEKGASAAFLWIPPQAAQIRGVILAGMTLAEREAVQDPQIRAACADQQLAIVFLKCGLGAADLQKLLDELGALSGYRELSVAPMFFIGHSAGGPQAKKCAVDYAARCFGLMQYRGGVPWMQGEPVPAGIPTLMMVGQFDEFGGLMRDENGREGAWEGARDGLADYRAADERRLASLVVEPGAGHFAWSQRNAAYLALFIRKAAQYRIPKQWPADSPTPPELLKMEPQSGWVTDLAIKKPQHPAAAYGAYAGDKTRANWHMDRELAEATVAYHTGMDRKDQFIRWNDAVWVDAGTRYYHTNLKWVGDGATVEVHPVYADTYPKTIRDSQGKPIGPRWAQEGQPAGHSKAPILVKKVGGPIEAVGPNLLRMRFDALAPADDGGRVTFMAYSVGDDEYRYTEQVGMFNRGFKGLTSGRDQTITFAPIGPLKANSPPVELKATSDAGLKVEYYVAHGPAEIVDGKLQLAEIPARAKFPIDVKVVAWQFGSGVEPKVKTAKPVEQTVRVERP